MIRSRESSDPWAHKAASILDQARAGHGLAEHIEWALAYLNDLDGSTKIPRTLMGGKRRKEKSNEIC